MDAKGKAIVAHITLIGWVIALILNNDQKDEFTSFYIRQVLGIMLVGMVASIFFWIPVIGWLIWLAVVIIWLLSLIYAAQGEMKVIPVLGDQFQEWFKSL